MLTDKAHIQTSTESQQIDNKIHVKIYSENVAFSYVSYMLVCSKLMAKFTIGGPAFKIYCLSLPLIWIDNFDDIILNLLNHFYVHSNAL